MEARVRLRLLGPVEVEQNGELVRGFESSKALTLLCYLASLDHSVSRTHLAALFWEDKPESRGRANLSRVLHNLSSLLPTCLVADRQSFQFRHTSNHTADIFLFDELVAQQTPEALAEAVSLYRGEFMEDIRLNNCLELENWLMAERERWRLKVCEVLLSLTSYHAERGQYQQALEYALQLLATEPWHEEAHRQVMLMLALSGQRSAALVQYENCRRILAEELAVAPTEETRLLYQRIRDETLEAQHQNPAQADQLPFLGREAEHVWLVDRWKAARKGKCVLTVVEGEPGIGKSRLVEEVLHLITKQPALVLRGLCHEFGAPLPYQCITTALRAEIPRLQSEKLLNPVWVQELAQLMPEVTELRPDLEEASHVPGEVARQRLFEAVARFLQALAEEAGSLVLLLEDLHWADDASLDLLHYLFHRLEQSPIWLLGTYQQDRIDLEHPLLLLHQSPRDEQRTGLLHLQRLGAETITDMARAMTGLDEESVKPLTRYLIDRSEGHPFILYQYTKVLETRGVLQRQEQEWVLDRHRLEQESSGRQADIPPAVLQLIQHRISYLPAQARELLDVAAVIGRKFDPGLLQQAVGADRPIQENLDHCVRQNLVTVLPTGQHSFTHGIIRDVLYETLPDWRRERLRRQVAGARDRMAAVEEQVAEHSAAANDGGSALTYLVEAARAAEPATALYLYDRAYRLVPRDDLATQFDIIAACERIHYRLGNHEEQQRDHQRLESLSRRLGDEKRQAEVLCRRTEWALNQSRFAVGARTARDAVGLARRYGWTALALTALQQGALCLLNQGEYQMAQQWGLEALALAGEQGGRQVWAAALSILGVIECGQRSHDTARAYLEEAVTEWRALGDTRHLARSLSTLALVQFRQGEYGQAFRTQGEARRLADGMEDRQLNACILTTLGNICHGLGRTDEAVDYFTEARLLGKATHFHKIEACALLSRAHAKLELGQIQDAEQDYRRSSTIQAEYDIAILQAETLNGLVDCLLAGKRYTEAQPLLAEVEGLLDGRRNRIEHAEYLLRAGKLYAGLRDLQKARQTTETLCDHLQTGKAGELPRVSFWWHVARLARLCSLDSRAMWALQQGDTLLAEQAARMVDGTIRQHFLEIMQVWRQRDVPQAATLSV